MLKSISVESFLSLKSVEVELAQLNILIGKNASGKSNFVKLLKFISQLAMHGHVSNVVRGLGFREFRDIVYGRALKGEVPVTLNAIVDGRKYTYTITFKAPYGYVEVEELQVEGMTMLKRKGPQSADYLKEDGSRAEVGLGADQAALHMAVSPGLPVNPLLRGFAGFLRGWAFYNFNPVAIRASGPIAASRELAYDGSNLPQVLHTLLTTRRGEFNRVEESLRSAVEEVEELLTPVEDSTIRVAVREKGFEELFSPEHLSDGTLRLLAFITALALPNPLVAFEEPENCVHPELLETLVELIRRSGKQVVITTHSPKLLDHVKPEEVYLVAKAGGESRIVRLTSMEDVDAVKRYLELGGRLGEAWLAGLLESGY